MTPPDPPNPTPTPHGMPTVIDPLGPHGPQALAMLLTGRIDASTPEVGAFVDYAREKQMNLNGLYAVLDRRGRPRRSTLVIPGVGHTAMLFVSPLSRAAEINAMAQVVATALTGPIARQASLVQALIDPDESLKHAALERGGMRPLAELLYLHRPGSNQAPAPAPPKGLSSVSWTPAHNAAFAQVIEASYEDTLDCPDLRGLRHTDDVIAGHRATGVFHPELWTLWSDAQGPVAVLLMAEAAAHPQAPPGTAPGTELVYLGIAPRGRRQGLGKALVDYAVTAATPFGGGISLAVDRDNPHARRLYRRAGFMNTARKCALIATHASP
ncbi:MAG: N-acetyltransferase [Algisphaera sp.]